MANFVGKLIVRESTAGLYIFPPETSIQILISAPPPHISIQWFSLPLTQFSPRVVLSLSLSVCLQLNCHPA
jgi:hypothetical protein